MSEEKVFSCFLIGSDTLLTECGEILVAAGHDVRGVISQAPRVVEWASKKGLAVVDPRAGYHAALAVEPFDFLFAITHLAIIPAETVALAQRGTINFHDGPLPRYAGLHAPAWALMAGEARHGISWHFIGDKVDAGALLKQVTFEIAPDETSLSLNTKCFAHAIESFGELVRELGEGWVAPVAQDLGQRSYFGRYRRPDAACVLDWSRPAAELEALVRALDFGERHANELGLAKIAAQGRGLAVLRAAREGSGEMAAPGLGAAPPGTVTFVRDDAIGVATGDGVLALLALSELDGAALSLAEAAARLELEPGSRLDDPSPAARAALGALDREMARAEPSWVARSLAADPIEAPFVHAYADGAPRFVEIALDALIPEAPPVDHAALVAALAVHLARIGDKDAFALGLSLPSPSTDSRGASPWLSPAAPLSLSVDHEETFGALRDRVRAALEDLRERPPFLRDLAARYPELRERRSGPGGAGWPVAVAIDAEPAPGCALALLLSDGRGPRLAFDAARIAEDRARALARQLAALLQGGVRDPEALVGKLPLLSEQESARLLVDYNRTERTYPDGCIHHLIEEQAARTPDAVAVVFEDRELTYADLNRRANRLAGYLRSLGVGPDVLVGVAVERSLELLVSALAVLKAGGAYVPLDPAYPAERIAFMVEDAALGVVLVDDGARGAALARAAGGPEIVALASLEERLACYSEVDLERGASAESLAYVIYTSGSTGKPKGVMVEHRNAMNFFAGMDDRVPHEPPGTWLAVTSLSFDISVLELFWPLTRGFKVVIHRDRERERSHARPAPRPVLGAVDFSLFYFSSDESRGGDDKYRLLLEGAKFADQHGFAAVWTPERHFHAFGGLYPNPAVTGAALAMVTERIQIRAGSVVLPLHHPAPIVEAWSMVDNLSRGRVGLSFASGWQPDDFVVRPEAFKEAKSILFRDAEVVRALWRGETVSFTGPKGTQVAVRTLPRPLQAELPTWITTAGNVDTYKRAGAMGANVLTHLLGQSVAELAPKIEAYRAARRENGHHPDAGVVTLMLHTFVGEDEDAVREAVRGPLKDYLGSSLELLKQYAWAFPAFSRPTDVAGDKGDDLLHLSAEERDALLEHAFERYYETSGLFGRPESCLALIDELTRIGVGEIACLIDFGVETERVLSHLTSLDRLRQMIADRAAGAAREEAAEERGGYTIAEELRRHQVTHLQCTPSMARMLLDDPETRPALGSLRCWMVGGEALPRELAERAAAAFRGRLLNMYGPTETTVWSTTHPVEEGDPAVPIGRPIANTRVYVLDPRGEPLPTGVAGELYIGGHGVARGYLGREELTRERFVPDPFARVGRMYRTGDLARWRDDGVLEFLGRRDGQIKIRGHRVEVGEIESALAREPGVRESVVVMREDSPGDQRLVAYVVASEPGLDEAALRSALRSRLPDFMVPSRVVELAALPHTPNRKIDRRALPAPLDEGVASAAAPAPYVAPQNELEATIAALWREILGREQIGAEDNFFDVGGHSLLVVRMHRRLREILPQPLTLTDLYRFPTIRSLTTFLGASGSKGPAHQGAERAEIRRELSQRRRVRHVEG